MDPTESAGDAVEETMAGTQTPRTGLLGTSLAVGAGTVVRLGSSFVLSIIIARALGAEPRGQLALVQQVPAIAALVLGLGFEGAHAYYIGRHRRRADEAVADSLLITGGAALIGIPLALLLMQRWIPALDAVGFTTLTLAAASIPFLVAGNLLAGVLTGLGRVTRQALAQIFSAVVTLGAVAVLFLTSSLSLYSFLLASLAGVALGVLVSFVSATPGRLRSPSLARLREQFGYARRNYVQTVTGYLEVRQDVLLLGVLSTASGVGVYTVGVSLAELLFQAPQALATSLTERSLQEGSREGARLTATVTRLLVALTVVSALLLSLVIGPLVKALFGAAFSGAAVVFWVLAPGITIWAAASQPTAYLATHGRLFPRLSTVMLFANLGLNLALIPSYGIVGAAVATTLTYTVSSTYIIRAFLGSTGVSWRELLLPRRSDVGLVAGAVRALVGRLATRMR